MSAACGFASTASSHNRPADLIEFASSQLVVRRLDIDPRGHQSMLLLLLLWLRLHLRAGRRNKGRLDGLRNIFSTPDELDCFCCSLLACGKAAKLSCSSMLAVCHSAGLQAAAATSQCHHYDHHQPASRPWLSHRIDSSSAAAAAAASAGRCQPVFQNPNVQLGVSMRSRAFIFIHLPSRSRAECSNFS